MKLNHRIIGDGRPVIILHGLFGMSDNWLSFAKMLSEDAFKVISVDLRNHGQSPHSDTFSYSLMAADVNELIHDLQLNNVVVIGHSMGGKVAMQLMNDFPDAVTKAIIVDIAPYYYPVHHREILDALLSVDLSKIKTRGEAEKILMLSINDLGTRQFLLKNLYWIQPEKLAWRFNLESINKNIEEIGKTTFPETPITIPTLFIKGENSKYLDETRYPEIKRYYTNAVFTEIKNAGHWVHADQPKNLLEVVLNFIERVINC